MLNTCRTALAVLWLGLGLGGCASTAQTMVADGGPPSSLADRFAELLQSRCRLPQDPAIDELQTRELRLLRAEWLLAVLARYGGARIEDFSGDKQADAAMLLTRVTRTMEIIKQAQADLENEPNQFEVYRADLIVALLNAANAAIRPSLKSVSGFVLKPNPEDGLDLLSNYFKDRLYDHAYSVTCTDFMNAAALPARRPAIRLRVDEHLREQCDRLARQSGLGSQCAVIGNR